MAGSCYRAKIKSFRNAIQNFILITKLYTDHFLTKIHKMKINRQKYIHKKLLKSVSQFLIVSGHQSAFDWVIFSQFLLSIIKISAQTKRRMSKGRKILNLLLFKSPEIRQILQKNLQNKNIAECVSFIQVYLAVVHYLIISFIFNLH